MTNATIFNGNDQITDSVTQSVTADENLFNALVGEQQKYKTPEDLAKAYANADQFIETLKEENRQLREKMQQAKTIDDVLERMTKQDTAPATDNLQDSGITPEVVQQLVEKTLKGKEEASKRTSNLLAADKLMKDKFGDKATEMFKQRASTPEKQKILMELAATDPQDFVALFGVANVQANNMDTSSVNTTSAPSTGNRDNTEWTKEWVAKIRKEKPDQYWSQDFQYRLQQTVTKNPDLYFGR